jgi:hypothetical protein
MPQARDIFEAAAQAKQTLGFGLDEAIAQKVSQPG